LKRSASPFLRLSTATVLSASSKSDFQQATIIRVIDPEKRAALAALIPAKPWLKPDRHCQLLAYPRA
jgi:FMN reductase [NAD(P)H]